MPCFGIAKMVEICACSDISLMLIRERTYDCLNQSLKLCIHLTCMIRSTKYTGVAVNTPDMGTYLTLINEVTRKIIPVSSKFMIDRHGYRISDRRCILGRND